jgi:hypothetical protein
VAQQDNYRKSGFVFAYNNINCLGRYSAVPHGPQNRPFDCR